MKKVEFNFESGWAFWSSLITVVFFMIAGVVAVARWLEVLLLAWIE